MAVSAGPDCVDSGLVLSLDPATSNTYSKNVHPKPNDIYGWFFDNSGFASNCIVSKDTTIVSPVGGNPLRMFVTGSDPHIQSYNASFWNLFPAAIGETWTVSVYVRATRPSTNAQLFLFGADNTGNAFGTNSEIAATSITLGTDWSRVSYTYTFTKSVSFVQVRLDGPDTGGIGDTIWWDGLQVENQSSATTFDGTRATTASIVDKLGNVIRPVSGPTINTATNTITFNGTNQYFNTGKTAGDLGIWDKSYTFDAWIYPTTFTGTTIPDRAIFGTREVSNQKGLHLVLRNGAIYQGHYSADFGVGTATLNQWQNITWTYDRETRRPSIYKNGVLLGTATAGIAPFIGDTNIMIGDWYLITSPQPFAGSGSCFNIYNRCLSATEVAQNFAALRSRFGI